MSQPFTCTKSRGSRKGSLLICLRYDTRMRKDTWFWQPWKHRRQLCRDTPHRQACRHLSRLRLKKLTMTHLSLMSRGNLDVLHDVNARFAWRHCTIEHEVPFSANEHVPKEAPPYWVGIVIFYIDVTAAYRIICAMPCHQLMATICRLKMAAIYL